jgi:hypothetical protein
MAIVIVPFPVSSSRKDISYAILTNITVSRISLSLLIYSYDYSFVIIYQVVGTVVVISLK